ncbi:PREDICTED: putative nuclease HARBI1 [Acropora digitifera]|uniref:putative nuclease HARBI1 n=1 Tax=Acropora digitifera TaxID=70779 RepID=UPI00077B0400|nr:PREDICTED: putative nuclease HARBI1 [Acropora digitifera]
MKRTTFEILVREVVGTGVLPVGNPFGRQVIDARKQVSIFLWCIANQETTRLIADRFNVTYSSVSRVVRRVTECVLALRNQYIKWPNGTQLRETMESFRVEGGFPGVVGVIDGSLVKIRAPVENPESYICRKKYHALQLQVVCDDNMMLLDAFTGWPGSVHDSRVLRNSFLFRSADQKFNDEAHLLGDGGYPLLTKICKTCKCKPEEHDIKSAEEEAHKLVVHSLFSKDSPVAGIRDYFRKLEAANKTERSEYAKQFAWSPPGLQQGVFHSLFPSNCFVWLTVLLGALSSTQQLHFYVAILLGSCFEGSFSEQLLVCFQKDETFS